MTINVELADFLEHVNLGFNTIGPDGVIQWANRAELRALGYEPHEYIGHHFSEFHLVKKDAECILARLLNQEAIYDHEVRLRCKDGSIKYALLNSSAHWAEGKFDYCRCVTHDITEFRLAQIKQASEHAVTRILGESVNIDTAAPSIIMTLCRALGAGAGAFWVLDRDRQILLNACVQILDDSDRMRRFAEKCRALTFKYGAVFPGRVWASGKAETISNLMMEDGFPRLRMAQEAGLKSGMAFPIGTGNDFLGVIEFFIARPSVPDQELLNMMSAIGSEIAQFGERRRAEDALQEADRRKDEFLATLAHELRSPLAALDSAARILFRSNVTGEKHTIARDTISKQVRYLTRLVDDLSDISRIKYGKIELTRETLDLRDAINNSVEIVQPQLTERGHKLILHMPAQPVYVDADRIRLSQIIVNLLTNAIKYTEPPGEIWLNVGIDRDRVVLKIRDNGMGIPLETLPYIFKMYTQAANTAMRSKGGLGIGLTLVNKLIEAHGGHISVQSSGSGTGSEFTVELPIGDPDLKAASMGEWSISA